MEDAWDRHWGCPRCLVAAGGYVDLNHAPLPSQGVGLAVLGSGTVPLTCGPALGDPSDIPRFTPLCPRAPSGHPGAVSPPLRTRAVQLTNLRRLGLDGNHLTALPRELAGLLSGFTVRSGQPAGTGLHRLLRDGTDRGKNGQDLRIRFVDERAVLIW